MTQLSTHIVVGASSGIGRSVALALARERRHVTLVGRHEERLKRVANEVVMFGGEPLVAISDVREPVSVQAALAQVVLRNLRIELAVLSSGVGLGTDAEEFTVETLQTLLEVNVLGVAHWLEALQPLLKAQPGGATTEQSWLPFLLEPEDAAQVILDGIRAEKRVIRFPRMAALTTTAIGLLPPSLLDRLYEMKPPGGVRVGNVRE